MKDLLLQTSDDQPRGIGGWLLLPLAGLAISIAFDASRLAAAEGSEVKPGVWVYLIFKVALLLQFLRKKSYVPRLMIALYVLELPISISRHATDPQAGGAVLLSWFIWAPIWIGYFSFSKRVRATFAVPSSGLLTSLLIGPETLFFGRWRVSRRARIAWILILAGLLGFAWSLLASSALSQFPLLWVVSSVISLFPVWICVRFGIWIIPQICLYLGLIPPVDGSDDEASQMSCPACARHFETPTPENLCPHCGASLAKCGDSDDIGPAK